MPAMTPEPTQRFVTTPDDVRIAYYEWPAPADAPVVLLAHATGFHGRTWEPVAVRLCAAGVRPVALDFRGHGDSDRTPEHYEWSNFAIDVLTVAHAIGLPGDPRGLGVGLSKGGAACMLAELNAPGTFARLWCYEPIVFPFDVPPPSDTEIPLSVAARKRRNTWASPAEAEETYRAKPPLNTLHPEALHAYVEHGLRETGDGTWVLKCAPEDEAAMYQMGIQHDAYARLASLTAPTTIACGEHTDALTPAMARQLVERLPQGTLDVWTGAGHFGPLEDPDRCVRALRATLTEND